MDKQYEIVTRNRLTKHDIGKIHVSKTDGFYHRCLCTGHSIPSFYTLHPFFHFFSFFFYFHGLEICKTAIICRYQSTDAIRKRHLYIHISRLMQSENGILWCKKGGCCVLSTSSYGFYVRKQIVEVHMLNK